MNYADRSAAIVHARDRLTYQEAVPVLLAVIADALNESVELNRLTLDALKHWGDIARLRLER